MVMVESILGDIWIIAEIPFDFAICLKVFTMKCIESDGVKHLDDKIDSMDCSFYQFFFLSTVLKWEHS